MGRLNFADGRTMEGGGAQVLLISQMSFLTLMEALFLQTVAGAPQTCEKMWYCFWEESNRT